MSATTPFAIDTWNEQGELLATKPYAAVDRRADILKNVFVFVLTSTRELLLGSITESHLSKKLYKGKLGTPTVTLLRHGEEPMKAAGRGLMNDLAIHPSKMTFLGEHLETMSDGTRRIMNVFFCIYDGAKKVNTHTLTEIRLIRRVELEPLLQVNPDQFSPQFITAYSRYKRVLPF